ncbi:biotin--[acetyl-CoA-carboxylase] ligase [Propionispora hippei]|uniref:Bifunctional ligase/repressor BirA n=1 Tax=Propionispora hippei DSM 15287 TaxID=1123003 RepID=A0A1M6JMK3_9FIRM|nr:biotin--[acetyl-CoA-carboxylase] ligase [Propionispora hippei]SHJ47898.1 BirA family transcriptional regulator, biotin operon repressor / biotin-[acetyl-CoA-carboxylase] ligase [Propionispora hippei DSM 15287]
MRSSILNVLRKNQGEYISGEEISRQLMVSRTAIWKHIRALKQDGYLIEAHPRRGYCLSELPDLLLPDEIKNDLSTQVLGKEIYWFDSIDSTSNEAKKLAAAGCPEGTLVLAEAQCTGRGRLARGWFSPRGKGIWLSVVLRPPFQPYDAPKCTLMTAVALTRAIRRATGVPCGIKWPNDILYNGKKVVGILTEMSAEMDAINYVVLGMGTNVNIAADEFPDELAGIATSLAEAAGRPFCRKTLLKEILAELETVYLEVSRSGFDSILKEWRRLSVTLGQTVQVVGPDKQFSGLAVDIDASGALLVQTDGSLETVIAGDVSIRPAMSEKSK